MFIVSDNKGKTYREGIPIGKDDKGNPVFFTWDDLPRKIKIAQIQLTYPFKVNFKGKGEYAPLLSVGKFDQYYFSNEATVKMLYQGDKLLQMGQSELEAKIVGGIDQAKDQVMEVRLDKTGNCSISRYPLSVLKEKIKQGTFRGDILRDGA